VATALSTALAACYYQQMQPLAGPTFRFGGVSPQDQVAQVHLRRAVPVAFGLMFGAAVAGGRWLVRTSRRSLLWIAVGGIAGVLGFAAAQPLVPLTGPSADDDYRGRVVTAADLRHAATVGGINGVLAGGVASVAWYGLTRRTGPGHRV
jgi:hypothetical protein